MQLYLLQIFLLLMIRTNWEALGHILSYFGMSTYSHRISVWQVAEQLADCGDNMLLLRELEYTGNARGPHKTQSHRVCTMATGFVTSKLPAHSPLAPVSVLLCT